MEIIKIQDSLYAKYEDLLIQRDEYKKESMHYYTLYIHEFGELITAVFQKKIECIKTKKMLAYCQKKVNYNQPIYYNELMNSINIAMLSYSKQLAQMIEENEECKELTVHAKAYILKVKKLYRTIALKIHPDANPELFENEEIRELWQRAVIAYQTNSLKELEEIKVLVNKALKEKNNENVHVEIKDLPDKIKQLQQEIDTIKTTDPYQYRYLIEDPELVNDKKEELNKELEEYQKYKEQLQSVLDTFNVIEVVS